MSGKRRGEPAGDHEGQSRKRRKYYAPKGQISGPGILLTTLRRKERKAGLDLIAFLEDLAEELYPDFDRLDSELSADDTDDDEVENNEDLDALYNGPPPPKPSVQQEVSKTELAEPMIAKKSKSNGADDDIEAQIQAELAELRPHKAEHQTIATKNGHDKKTKRERFRLVDLEVECLMFVTVAKPMDPVRLCCALLDRVAKTGQVRGRFIQRLSPIYGTTRAEEGKIATLAEEIMAEYFPKTSEDEPVTFKVEPRIRLHNQLSKMDVIMPIAAAVPKPHRADLNNPDYLINVEVLKSGLGIGILPRYEEFKRYNPQTIAQRRSESQKDGEEDAAASSRMLLR